MAENAESVSATETKKVIINPRVEIDTSPPFESVKEAVDRFGGSGPWIPHHLLRLAGSHDDWNILDMENMEEQASKLERDLTLKEQKTLNVLKELEATRRFIEDLKFNLMPEMSSLMANSDLKMESHSMAAELNQAKLNLNKTSVDLAVIQASVESLNQKLRRDKVLLEGRTKVQQQQPQKMQNCQEPLSENRTCDDKVRVSNALDDISRILANEGGGSSYEAEQFKKMTEASRYEVMKAMAEIERTKNSIKMAEMRLNAAKKMEEAAKAVEAIALAERKAFMISGGDESSSLSSSSDGITLSFQEYRALAQKARQAKTKFIDTNGVHVPQPMEGAHQLEMPILEKFEETSNEEDKHPHNPPGVNNKFKFRNSHSGHYNYGNDNNPACGSRSTTSIGDVLSRKFIVQDDVMVGRHVVENHSERQHHHQQQQQQQHVSLSQMLRKQSKVILNPPPNTSNTTTRRRREAEEEHNVVEKHYLFQRKKFGFIQVPLPTRQNKRKGQPSR